MKSRLTFARIIYRMRNEKKLTTRKFAKEVGVTGSTVARWERDNIVPDPEGMFRLIIALGLDEQDKEETRNELLRAYFRHTKMDKLFNLYNQL